MITKKCYLCKKQKPQSEYYFDTPKNTYKGVCKYCYLGQILSSRRTNKRLCTATDCNKPHYALDYCRRHHSQLKRTGKIITKGYAADGPTKITLSKYGVTKKDFDEMSASGCQICGTSEALILEHDHSCCAWQNKDYTYCGECTRGVVCFSCNISISKYETDVIREDNPVRDKIRDYLISYEVKKAENDKRNKNVYRMPGGLPSNA